MASVALVEALQAAQAPFWRDARSTGRRIRTRTLLQARPLILWNLWNVLKMREAPLDRAATSKRARTCGFTTNRCEMTLVDLTHTTTALILDSTRQIVHRNRGILSTRCHSTGWDCRGEPRADPFGSVRSPIGHWFLFDWKRGPVGNENTGKEKGREREARRQNCAFSGDAMRACFAAPRGQACTRRDVRVMAASEAKPETTIRRHPPSGAATQPCGVMQFRVDVEGNKPRNILEEIVWYKDVELTSRKQRLPLANLMQMVKVAAPARDFVGALLEKRESTGLPGLIAEVKKASPSKGIIRENFNPVEIAMAYEEGGAACLSVLTDEKFFQGGFENLKLIRNAGVRCPLLCKDFIVDAYQVFLARAMGADAILLIAAVLPNQDLAYLTKAAKKLGMVALVEVHTSEEMERVLKLDDIDLLGINNRNLEDFTVDLHRTVDLMDGPMGDQVRERGITVVGESGIFAPADVKVLQDVGVGAILVGESIVKQGDIATGVRNLLQKV